MFRNTVPTLEELGIGLYNFRVAAGLTQGELSEIVGILPSNLSAIENGRRTMGRLLAIKLGDALGVDYRLFL